MEEVISNEALGKLDVNKGKMMSNEALGKLEVNIGKMISNETRRIPGENSLIIPITKCAQLRDRAPSSCSRPCTTYMSPCTHINSDYTRTYGKASSNSLYQNVSISN